MTPLWSQLTLGQCQPKRGWAQGPPKKGEGKRGHHQEGREEWPPIRGKAQRPPRRRKGRKFTKQLKGKRGHLQKKVRRATIRRKGREATN